MAPRRRALGLVALALSASVLAPLANAGSRHRDYGGASEDVTIFFAILSDSMGEGTLLVDAAVAGDTQAVEERARALSSLTSGFSDELVEIIGERGTTPPALATLREDLVTFNQAGQRLAGAYIEFSTNIRQVTGQPGEDSVDELTGALDAQQATLGAIEDVRLAAELMEARAFETADLLQGLFELEVELVRAQGELQEALSQLRLPALLTLTADRRAVPLDDRFTVTGLGLAGGDPAPGTPVILQLGTVTRTTRVDQDGRFRLAMP
ncbi:MAG: hypothetical protein R3185_07230, partial [Candidatus Thermoplasmatota archaeon]|nr:hypothetical protein [Candidatus Thermoplasmatota archaeon]